MDDLISRQAAIAAFDCTDELIICGSANAQNVMNYINKVIGKIKALPSALTTGKWIIYEVANDPEEHPIAWECDACGAVVYCKTRFCPECGQEKEV